MSNIESDQVNEEFRSSSEVDFYINNEMVHIADTKVATRFSDFFIRQIQKINEVRKTLLIKKNIINLFNSIFLIRYFADQLQSEDAFSLEAMKSEEATEKQDKSQSIVDNFMLLHDSIHNSQTLS